MSKLGLAVGSLVVVIFMNWTTTDKLLLSGLLPSEASCARLGRLLERESEINWEAVVQRALTRGTAALLRLNLARIGELDGVPLVQRAALEEINHRWAARHLAFVSEATRLLSALAESGIQALPLKGTALMLTPYYPQIGLRAAVDMDVLVEPGRIEQAERIVSECGYTELEATTQARPRQRLPNERNHRPPRRGPSGLILELHHRAFHHTQRGRDFGFAEMIGQAKSAITSGQTSFLLPAPEDLCLHLVHHTIVDLQSTRSILRTLADLYFIFEREVAVRERLKQRASAFGLGGAVQLACEACDYLTEATLEELERAPGREDIALLLKTALLESPDTLAATARLFEYFDLRHQPLAKIGNLLALLFTSKQHLAQLYHMPATSRIYLNYLRRPFDLLRKFNWASLAPANLRQVRKLRKIAQGNLKTED